jgi:hypothetical protein
MIHGSRVEDNTFVLACEASDAVARGGYERELKQRVRAHIDRPATARRNVRDACAACAVFRPALDAPHQQEDDYD